MKISTELFEEDVRELAEKANIDKPGILIRFLYHRARGLTKTDIQKQVGVSRQTLKNWEDKMDTELNVLERSEIAAKSSIVEHDKRLDKEGDDE